MEELSTAEAANVAGVDQSSVRRAIREGRLKGRKVVRDYVVKRHDLEAWMRARRPAAT